VQLTHWRVLLIAYFFCIMQDFRSTPAWRQERVAPGAHISGRLVLSSVPKAICRHLVINFLQNFACILTAQEK